MTLSGDLWKANHDLVQACLDHPFVQGLADGSLSRERFAYYVGQDVFFLKAFARSYSIAGARAPEWDGFCTLHTLADGVLEELKLHVKYAAGWGVDLINVAPGAATRRYTDFLMATAWSCDTGITVAAMSPCMRLYTYFRATTGKTKSFGTSIYRLDSHLQQPGFRRFGKAFGRAGEPLRIRHTAGTLHLPLRHGVRARFFPGRF